MVPVGATKRADAVLNRARILKVAQTVFAEYGLELEMSEVATRAQLGVGTLYRHFANREELLRAIVQITVEDVHAQLQSVLISESDDPRDLLLALVKVGLRLQQQYRPIFDAMRDPRLSKLLNHANGQTLRDRYRESATEIIDQGIKAGIFRDDLDPRVAAATVMGSFNNVYDLLGTHCTFDELVQRLYQLLLAMLLKPTAMES